MVKIALDAGHGLNTPGKRSPAGEREWSFNDTVLRWLIHNLKSYEDVEVLRLDDPTGRRDVPLKERTDKANAWGADSLVSVHHNGLLGKWGNHTGTETYIYPDSVKGMELAQAVHPEIVRRFKLRDRGIKKENFHMLRESNMPAILTEGGYMDSSIDIVALRSEERLRAQADGITAGLVKFHRLKKKAAPAPVKPQPDASKPNSKPKEDEDMLEVAIVINSLSDYAAAESLAIRNSAPIYPRRALKGKVAKHVIVVGGEKKGIVADKVTDLSGKDRFETSANVKKYISK
ncbi:N-acetylmuramoyl-L-alanine amidase [Chryseomicrobium palamuruense]